MAEKVNHPGYYQFGKSEVIDIARELTYNCGVALAYVARSGRADDSLIKVEEGMTPNEKRIEDYRKAIFHLNNEIERLQQRVR